MAYREIPSQRLAVPRSSPSAQPAAQHRSIWWAVGVSVAGWALLAYPAFLLCMLSLLIVNGSLDGNVTAGSTILGILGFMSTACMVVFPPLLGFAVKTRRRSLWLPAILTGALSLVMSFYLLVGWIIPFA
ncbi:hypothetical protein ACFUCV_04010 [Specibacter sp. NPDC057265]|uniref:hypothetical protein n=1 Tax=Specibacter sp. NPDC057265 TaxID=3346075 RepID=UPI003632BECE